VDARGERRRLNPWSRSRRASASFPSPGIGEYQALVADALRGLNAGTEGMVAELANLPDLIRGYEDVKLRDVERFRGRAQELVEQLDLTRHPMDPSPR
jgi:indolepyruvate ferredoxin oxidoreductase